MYIIRIMQGIVRLIMHTYRVFVNHSICLFYQKLFVLSFIQVVSQTICAKTLKCLLFHGMPLFFLEVIRYICTHVNKVTYYFSTVQTFHVQDMFALHKFGIAVNREVTNPCWLDWRGWGNHFAVHFDYNIYAPSFAPKDK